MSLAIKYTLFAIAATLTNIFCQDLTYKIYNGSYGLYLSMLSGTLAGLTIKYILDKTYIFSFRTQNLVQDGQKFVLYSVMGIGTTLIFWGFEMIFDFTFNTIPMRYTGAIIGLALGYYIKYRLDKRFVFVEYA